MNVLLTGASGFLGGRIYAHLTDPHTVTTLGRTPAGPHHVACDLATTVPDLSAQSFDWVIHAAGKAHSVPRSVRERIEYERVNVGGTANLLTALERTAVLPHAFVHISTVLVYGRPTGTLLDETTPLGATDAYGLSKVRAETAVRDWSERTGVRVAILRLPMVVADPPNGNVAALLNAIRRGYYVRIGDGLARRSMVRADDVAAVIERAGEVGGTYHLTDGRHPRVRDLEDALARQVGRRWLPTVPVGVARAVARAGDGINAVVSRRFPLDSVALQKLTGSLTFADDAARRSLNWNPRSVLDLFA